MRFVLIFIVLINFLYPSFDTFNHAHQDNLISSSSRDLEQGLDIQFQIGPNVTGFKEWKRIRLGFPDRPIVIDTQFESRIIQGRINLKSLLINIIPTYIIIVIFGVRRLTLRRNSEEYRPSE